MSEVKKNKTNCPKKIKIPLAWTAEVAGASMEMVKKVRNGDRKPTGQKGQNIELADMLLQQEVSGLINELKQIVQL